MEMLLAAVAAEEDDVVMAAVEVKVCQPTLYSDLFHSLFHSVVFYFSPVVPC